MALSTGTQLGPYQVVALIGAGGMGGVYRARDPRLHREVAIKIVPESFSSDPVRLQRFEQEAHAAAALNHPNILAVYDIGEQNGLRYIVSELLHGETLGGVLRGGSMPLRKVVDYAIQIAHGLAAAHDKAVVHRDLKPDNIFVTKDGRVKILDFGLARLLASATGDLDDTPTREVETTAGAVMGTVGYLSPEQVRGSAADARSDIFALGVVLYEMITGRRAFRKPSGGDADGCAQRRAGAHFTTLPDSAAGTATRRQSLPDEESRAALPACLRPGVRIGSDFRFNYVLRCHRRTCSSCAPALASLCSRSRSSSGNSWYLAEHSSRSTRRGVH